MRRSAVALFATLFVMSCGSPRGVAVQDIWTRDTVGRKANAAVFMQIRSDAADQLVGAETPVAKKTALMTFHGDTSMMRMRYVDVIEIPGDAPVSLDPRGLHVWLTELNEPLRQGQTFPLILRFRNAGERRVLVNVIAPSAAAPMSGM